MSDNPLPLFADHPRTYRENRFVYPVVSRRSRGLSLGVNLNPDKVCNFGCIYCQVDRTSLAETRFVETERLLEELDAMFRFVADGRIYADERFRNVPTPLRRLNDVAFSGDGEPTTFRNFDEIVASVAALKQRHRLPEVKLVLITNASMFHRPAVARGLKILDENNSEIWAKLDAGTEAYYHEIEQTKIPFPQIIENITLAARLRPVVIQSLFLQIDGTPVSDGEIEAFCDRLNEIVAAGGRISLVQIYTVARKPAVSSVTALSDEYIDCIAACVRQRTGLSARAYHAN